jgi:hypothetical protein
MTGTGLLPYIRPVGEEWLCPLALMKVARIVLINLSVLSDLGVSQVFDTPVLPVMSSLGYVAFAIVGCDLLFFRLHKHLLLRC